MKNPLRPLLILLCAGSLMLVAGCVGADEAVHATPVPARVTPPNELEQALLDEVNRYRASRGLERLKQHNILIAHARAHSENMAKGRVRFGHDGFKQRANEIRNYISVIEIAENLAVNKGYVDPVAVAFQSLMKSAGHRRNIAGDFDLTGVGVSKSSDGTIYFTQLFADGAGRFR
jgi:uncharacterized protein YkwD